MSNSVAHTSSNFNDSLETKPRRKGGRPKKQAHAPFVGFTQESIQGEYFQVPAIFLSLCAMIDNLAELKVVMYIMRHTWGFREYGMPKRITIDEFMYGRKRTDGTRMDLGIGLSESAIKDGLQRAIDHEIIICYVDDSDQARIKNYYELKMQNEESASPEPDIIGATFEKSATPSTEGPATPDGAVAPFTEDYDPYAGTIFSQQSAGGPPPEQKIFVSEPELITPSEGVNNTPGGSKQLPRSENRTQESTLRTNDIRITHPSEIEDFIRSFPDHLPKAKAKSPAFIRNMILDFSRDLGDYDHVPSNIAQASKLYRDSGMSEETFMQALYEARATAKRATQIKYINSRGGMNRMPYFFRCLSGAVRPQDHAHYTA